MIRDDPHHPPQTATPAPSQPTPPPNQPGMGGMPMMNMMSNMPMMNMMGMMRMMRMMGQGTAGMATVDHVEGRIAFLRTELKITEAQASAWNAFGDALRTNAKKLGDVRASMMPQPSAGQPQAPTMAERLDLQERWLLARLEGTRTIRSAFTKLYETLSDDQKKSANEFLAPHMGMGMMAMMPAQMQPAQMQPGQMQPGHMHPGAR
jgi:LTXXQ motif family protein